jgi:hypothetical protein
MSTNDNRTRRSLSFLAVVMLHVAVVTMIVRLPQANRSPKSTDKQIILVFLKDQSSMPVHTVTRAPSPSHREGPAGQPTNHSQTVQSTIIDPAKKEVPPTIDWEHEAQIAVQHGGANNGANDGYRDLSGLSAAQLEWLQKNNMKRMHSDFAWDHRRRDNGNPLGLFWINDYCVIVVMIPFCRWGGKIQPNGNLFDHMYDSKDGIPTSTENVRKSSQWSMEKH